MDTLSLDAAEAITGISSRTLRRRASDGSITSGERDARGRATMALADALRLAHEGTGLVFSAGDAQVLLQADAGDAAAQADMGALFYLREEKKGMASPAALYWLRLAASQNNPEAMHWLGTACAEADPPDAERAVMWIARAAALGHPVAQQQIDALLGAALEPAPG